MDLAPRNLILDRHWKIWILDRAYAGGYPIYFEKAALQRAGLPSFKKGLLEMIGEENSERVERLLALGFALSIAAYTKPAGGFNVHHEKSENVDV